MSGSYRLGVKKGKDVKTVRTVDLHYWIKSGYEIIPETCDSMPKDRREYINKVILENKPEKNEK